MERKYSQAQAVDANNAWSFISGLFVGGLIGAGTMLMLAPQSGKKTRTQIHRKGLDIRDTATEGIEDVVEKVGDKARRIRASFQKEVKDLDHRGQDMFDEQKKRGITLVEAGKTALGT